jgi:hypothetical protein
MRLNRNMTDGNGRIFLIQMTQLTYLRNNHFIVLAFLVKSIRRGGGLKSNKTTPQPRGLFDATRFSDLNFIFVFSFPFPLHVF